MHLTSKKEALPQTPNVKEKSDKLLVDDSKLLSIGDSYNQH